MIAYLLIALYWIACCITVYIIRNRKNPLHKITRAKTKFWEHIIIVLLSPLAVPIILLGFAYRACRNWYYRNRPKPLPKRIKKYMKKDGDKAIKEFYKCAHRHPAMDNCTAIILKF